MIRAAMVLMTVLVTLLVVDAGPAVAQEEAPREYETAIDEAVSAFAAGRWSEARAAFQRGQEIFPNARALRGVGMAAFELSDYLAAAAALEAALAESRRALTERQRTHAGELLEQCFGHLARFTVPAAAEGATLWVDGAAVSPEGWPAAESRLLLASGSHEISIALGDRVARTQVEIAGGEQEALGIDLTPLQQLGTPADDAGDGEAPSTEEHGRTASESAPEPRVVTAQTDDGAAGGWATFGAGLGVAAVGAILLGVGVDDRDAVLGASMGTEWSELRARYDRAPALIGSGGAVLGVGLATAAIGAILAIAGSGGAEDDVRVGASGVEVSF